MLAVASRWRDALRTLPGGAVRPYTAVTLALVLIAGCNDFVSPQDMLGTHPLVTIQGHAPPQIVLDAPMCRITVIGGSLELRSDNYFALELEEVTICPTPTEPGQVGELWSGTYNFSGSAMILHAHGDPSVDFYSPIRSGRLMVPLGERYGDVEFMLRR